jgi:hypothetical protein
VRALAPRAAAVAAAALLLAGLTVQPAVVEPHTRATVSRAPAPDPSGSAVGPGDATGDWSATYDASITSRSWATGRSGDVWVDVRAISGCGGEAHGLALYRRGGAGWSRVGAVRDVGCSGSSSVWRAVAKGTYRFELWDRDTTDAYRDHAASGTVRYR